MYECKLLNKTTEQSKMLLYSLPVLEYDIYYESFANRASIYFVRQKLSHT